MSLGFLWGRLGYLIFIGETAPNIFMIRAYESNSPGSKLLPKRRFPGNFIFNSGKTFLICKILKNNYYINNKLPDNSSH